METSSNQSTNFPSALASDASRKDDALWQLAKKRAGFKWSLASYLFVNTFLIGVWYFTSGNHYNNFWPIWPLLGWGVGITFQYFNAYHSSTIFSTEQEYEKLKNSH